MKRLFKIMMFLVMTAYFVGCQHEDVIEITKDQNEWASDASTVNVCMNLNIPNLIKFSSRSGNDFQNILNSAAL